MTTKQTLSVPHPIFSCFYISDSMGGSKRGTGVRIPPLNNHRYIGFPSNIDPDPLKIHKATKPAFNVGSSLACQRNAIQWHFTSGPMMAHLVIFGSSFPSSTKKSYQIWTPSDKSFWIRVWLANVNNEKAWYQRDVSFIRHSQ